MGERGSKRVRKGIVEGVKKWRLKWMIEGTKGSAEWIKERGKSTAEGVLKGIAIAKRIPKRITIIMLKTMVILRRKPTATLVEIIIHGETPCG